MRSKAAAAMDWELLATTSHVQTAVAIREKLQQQGYEEAMPGLEASSLSQEHLKRLPGSISLSMQAAVELITQQGYYLRLRNYLNHW
jgi:hypothetical protein